MSCLDLEGLRWRRSTCALPPPMVTMRDVAVAAFPGLLVAVAAGADHLQGVVDHLERGCCGCGDGCRADAAMTLGKVI